MQTPTTPKRRLLTIADVAEISGIAPETVRRMTDRGAMPAPVRLEGAVRYRLDEIHAWIEAGCPDLSKGGRR